MRKSPSLLFAILGILLAIVSGVFLFRALTFKFHSLETTGTIISYKQLHRRAGIYYMPTIEFIASDGKAYRFIGSGASNTTLDGPPKVGEIVSMRYDPDDPTEASQGSDYFIPSLAGLLFGLILTFVGLFVCKKNRRERFI